MVLLFVSPLNSKLLEEEVEASKSAQHRVNKITHKNSKSHPESFWKADWNLLCISVKSDSSPHPQVSILLSLAESLAYSTSRFLNLQFLRSCQHGMQKEMAFSSCISSLLAAGRGTEILLGLLSSDRRKSRVFLCSGTAITESL